MVSTRGIKPKYEINERVLCYEPDPKKMKMLYDARVLEMRPSEKGERRGFEYCVHFLGWNATWDRYVADDMLLKDDKEGRKEQTALYELLQSTRKTERKKKRKSTDKIRLSTDSRASPLPSESSPEGKNKRLSGDSPAKENEEPKYKKIRTYERNRHDEIKTEKIDVEAAAKAPETTNLPSSAAFNQNLHSILLNDTNVRIQSTEDPQLSTILELVENNGEEKVEEEICTEPICIQFPDALKKALEKDWKTVSCGKLVKLPAETNIVTLLEGYVRKFAINRLAAVEKQIQKNNVNSYRMEKDETEYFDQVRNSINLCKEVAEGFRILIDFLLGTSLLYPQEREQFSGVGSIRPHMESIERMVADVSHLHRSLSLHNKPKKDSSATSDGKKRLSRKKDNSENETQGLSGSGGGSMSSGTETPTLSTVSSSSAAGAHYPQHKQSHVILRELESWKLLPESVYFENPAPLSLIFGGVHLARFAVNLPDMFVKMRFPMKKVKLLTRFVEFLVEYVTSQSEEILTDASYTQTKSK